MGYNSAVLCPIWFKFGHNIPSWLTNFRCNFRPWPSLLDYVIAPETLYPKYPGSQERLKLLTRDFFEKGRDGARMISNTRLVWPWPWFDLDLQKLASSGIFDNIWTAGNVITVSHGQRGIVTTVYHRQRGNGGNSIPWATGMVITV